ncbi:MAG TPA: YbhB/YbcL family Raf kinase inhibitor-like protein [Terriglobales bacterium]
MRLSTPDHRTPLRFLRAASLLLMALAVLPARSAPQTQDRSKGAPAMTFTLRSPDFANGANIPRVFSCEGEDRSPALEWSNAPAGTKTFALIVDDPDAPFVTWVHWVIYNIPGTAHGLSAGVEKKDQLADGSRQGRNDFHKTGYDGPCPPPGKAHRYFFKLYALSTELTLASGAKKYELESAMGPSVLAQAEWMGRYQR